MKHTKGPWEAGMHSDRRLGFNIYAPDMSEHADPDCLVIVAGEAKEADALLMAAAPDLLTALQALLPEGWGKDDTMDHMPGVKLARAAIAKATGATP